MRIQTALRAVAAVCALALAPNAASAAPCTHTFYFASTEICTANKPEVLELAPGATSTPCGRSFKCPLNPCSITVTLPAENAACVQLETKVTAKEMLTKKFDPPCEISVAGQPFGRVYDADDKSRHFKFNTSAGIVDYALTGKNAAQRVPIPPAARKCIPRPTQWECSGFGSTDIACYQPGVRFDNGAPLIKFDKRGDFGVCIDLARTLQQTPSILSVASCLVPPPKSIPPSVAQGVKEAEAKGQCPGTWNIVFIQGYQECIVNYSGTGDAWSDCCDILRKRAQERNGRSIGGGGGTVEQRPD